MRMRGAGEEGRKSSRIQKAEEEKRKREEEKRRKDEEEMMKRIKEMEALERRRKKKFVPQDFKDYSFQGCLEKRPENAVREHTVNSQNKNSETHCYIPQL